MGKISIRDGKNLYYKCENINKLNKQKYEYTI